jgi:hypothetical protein
LNKEFLHQKYIKNGLSTRRIAEEIGFSKNTIRNALLRFGIPLRVKGKHSLPSEPPYGFCIENGNLVRISEEQRIIRSIVKLREQQKLSFYQIAKFLDSIGVPTKKDSEKGWHRETVRSIYLSNLKG